MINLRLSLSNPWAKDNFKNLFCVSKYFGGNVAFEFEMYRNASTLFNLTLSWTVRRDHAGPFIELGLLGYEISAKVYDTRHWDDENNRWETYD